MNEKDAVYVRIAQAYYSKADWPADIVLMPGEVGWESDTGKFKVGDGQTSWQNLPYHIGVKIVPDDFDETEEFIFDCGEAPIPESN